MKNIYLKIITRGLFRSHSLINLFGFSIGITAILLIVSFILNERGYDRFNENYSGIYRIEEGKDNYQLPISISHEAVKQFPEVENSVALISFGDNFLSNKYVIKEFKNSEFCFAENAMFEIFSFDFILGDRKTALTEPYTIVLSESTATFLFKGLNPVGQQIKLNNNDHYTVTGIVKDISNSHLPTQAIASYATLEKNGEAKRNNWSMLSYLLLSEKHNLNNLKTKMDVYFKGHKDYKSNNIDFHFRPLSDIYLATNQWDIDETKQGNKSLLSILVIVSILILVLICINFVNFSIIKGLQGSSVLGVNKVLGAKRYQLISKFLIETVLHCAVALSFSFILLKLASPIYSNFIDESIVQKYILNFSSVLFIIGGLVLLSVVAGTYPALYLTSINPLSVLRGKTIKTGHSILVRKTLLISQFAIAILLCISTITILSQLHYIRNREIGFNKNQIVYFPLNEVLKNKKDILKHQLLQIPDISMVSYSMNIPCDFNGSTMEIQIDNENKKFSKTYIDPDFIELMGFEVLNGRNFKNDITSDQHESYIMNERASQLLQNSFNSGEHLIIENRKSIGVLKDFHFNSLHTHIEPLIFYWDENRANVVNIRFNPNKTPDLIDRIKEICDMLSPGYPFKYAFLNDTFDHLYKKEKQLAQIITCFTILALSIACLGLLGLVKFMANQRTKEIGIRKVNGAQISEIINMLNKDFIQWVAIAYLIACPVAYYAMNKWLENFAYKTSLSWWIFASAGLLALSIALLTVSWQSWKAASCNPVKALRYE